MMVMVMIIIIVIIIVFYLCRMINQLLMLRIKCVADVLDPKLW